MLFESVKPEKMSHLANVKHVLQSNVKEGSSKKEQENDDPSYYMAENQRQYFKHLLLYKDGRFARHVCLLAGKVYIKQTFTDSQITVRDIQERIAQGDHN